MLWHLEISAFGSVPGLNVSKIKSADTDPYRYLNRPKWSPKKEILYYREI
jgi:hypothetical protein